MPSTPDGVMARCVETEWIPISMGEITDGNFTDEIDLGFQADRLAIIVPNTTNSYDVNIACSATTGGNFEITYGYWLPTAAAIAIPDDAHAIIPLGGVRFIKLGPSGGNADSETIYIKPT